VRDALFHIERDQSSTLQVQIRQVLISTVLSGQLPPGDPVPSTRAMAKRLGVSRNTVVLAYQGLVASGFLVARERSGYYVHQDVTVQADPVSLQMVDGGKSDVEWRDKLMVRPGDQRNITKPDNWRQYPYPFIYGQSDDSLFPIAEWRDCVRQAHGRKWLDAWTEDRFSQDDPMLIEQIRRRILPRRGIQADTDEILVTLGAQNALYLVSRLLISAATTVGVEMPGYPDMRNIVRLRTDHLVALPIDSQGMELGDNLRPCDLIYTTPSHQFPTTVTMSIERRKELLDRASKDDFLIVEDDYEFETNYLSEPCPALKSLDARGRVIYVGSLSKSLVPGLRVGFMVADRELISQATALRRLMLRHPPGNNQRTVAIFLANGHHDTLIARQNRVYRERWRLMGEALGKHLPGWSEMPTFGGTSNWLKGPADLDAEALAEAALDDGIVIEPGGICFENSAAYKNYFRLGFSSISSDRIGPGIERLAAVIQRHLDGRTE
jgi:GntR family transcriptional regulator/MocR family aminotransferase